MASWEGTPSEADPGAPPAEPERRSPRPHPDLKKAEEGTKAQAAAEIKEARAAYSEKEKGEEERRRERLISRRPPTGRGSAEERRPQEEGEDENAPRRATRGDADKARRLAARRTEIDRYQCISKSVKAKSRTVTAIPGTRGASPVGTCSTSPHKRRAIRLRVPRRGIRAPRPYVPPQAELFSPDGLNLQSCTSAPDPPQKASLSSSEPSFLGPRARFTFASHQR